MTDSQSAAAEPRHWVVRNDEEQYSVWPADLELPAGWSVAGPEASREECLDYIEKVWTDMRPKSLRVAMEQDAG